MKTLLHITATVDQPDLLKNLVEKLAYRRNDMMSHQPPLPLTRTVDSSSTEAYISGTIGLDYFNEQFNVPYITCFVFTCLRSEKDGYELAWAQSLS